MTDILVVDDHPVNLHLMRGQLRLLGRQCDCTVDPHEALALWQRGQYRLIIMDCHMAAMSGHDLTRAIRDLEADRGVAPGVPIIAWTADAFEPNLRACREAGMNDRLIKPTLLEPLRTMVATWLPTAHAAVAAAVTDAAAASTDRASVFDERTLHEFSGGDVVLEREIFTEFRAANVRDLAALREAVAQSDPGLSRMVAHRIKGACRILGATALADLFEDIEQSSRNPEDWPRVPAALDRVAQELERLEAFMRLRLPH